VFSPLRLSIRNIPFAMTEGKLKALAVAAVKARASKEVPVITQVGAAVIHNTKSCDTPLLCYGMLCGEVCGRAAASRAVHMWFANGLVLTISFARHTHSHDPPQVKILREEEGGKVGADGKPKSKGMGFIEFR
jgi:hypothetical protein